MASINTIDGTQLGSGELAAKAASDATISNYIDLAISLELARWNALSIAVSNQWGGPDSADKRDWLAGVISQLFEERPATDEQDVEDVLLQVMADEFDLQLEDESEIATAAEIVRLRKRCLAGDFSEVEALRRRWQEKPTFGAPGSKIVIEEREEEVDDDEDGGVSLEDGDVEMSEAPATAPTPRPKPEPEIDDDGFMTVRRKR